MPPTWTRFIPDHYDSATNSPWSLADTVDSHSFSFLHLPVELRLQVYKDYLNGRYSPSPAEIHEMVLETRYWTESPAEILQVSKAVNAEVQDLLRHESTIDLRICWQDAAFDGLAISCFQARGKRLDYDSIAHLRVDIYPPHLDRPTDIIRIWRHIRELFSDLQGASCVQRLPYHFMENEYAIWSLAGKPMETMNVRYDFDRLPSDILHILDLFRLLINVTKAQIYLPVSLSEDTSLQKSKQDTEDAMMKVKLLGDGHKELVIKTIEEAVAEMEESLEYCTGSFSQDKLDRLCPYGYWISAPHLDVFERVWPHRDSLFEWEYKRRSEYIGVEDLENIPGGYVDPYESEHYCYETTRTKPCDYVRPLSKASRFSASASRIGAGRRG